jgi:hypothetical protein
MLATYRRNQALLLEAPTASENGPADMAAARTVIEGVFAAGREMLDEPEAKAVLTAYAIPVVPTIAVMPDADAAAKAAREIGYPVAIKILSPDISHKSDVGSVHLHLRDEEELRKAAQDMLSRVRESKPQVRITGLTVQSMVTRPLAQEWVPGASIDPRAEEAKSQVLWSQALDERPVLRLVFRADRPDDDRLTVPLNRFCKFSWIRGDREVRRAGVLLAADAQAGVQRDHAFVIGEQWVDVQLCQLRQVSEHLRESDEYVADRIDLRWRMVAVTSQQLRHQALLHLAQQARSRPAPCNAPRWPSGTRSLTPCARRNASARSRLVSDRR